MILQFIIVGASPNRVAQKFLEPALAREPPSSIVALPEIQYQLNDSPVSPAVANFCFPRGVRVTCKSAQETQQIVYSHAHLQSDQNSYCFVLTSATNTLIFGICVRRAEVIDDFPSFIDPPRLSRSERGALHKRGHVTAPRCYCILSHHPFITLHFDLLYSILSLEQFRTMEHVSSLIRKFGLSTDAVKAKQTHSDDDIDMTQISLDENPLFRRNSALHKVVRRKMQSVDAKSSRTNSRNSTFEKFGMFVRSSITGQPNNNNNTNNSSNQHPKASARHSISFMPASNLVEDLLDDDAPSDTLSSEFRKERSGIVDVLKRYSETKAPRSGESLEFSVHSDASPAVLRFTCPSDDFEAALMSNWTISAAFRFLSLANILKIMSLVLTERSLVFVSSEVGRLSAVVLSLIPLLRPYAWQCLFVPLLPDNMHMFLEAPVPFIVGLSEVTEKILASPKVTVVFIDEDRLQTNKADYRPLPDQQKLINDLTRISIVLRNSFSASTPLHITNSTQDATANALLGRINSYLTNLTDNLKACSITEVDQSQRQASLVLKSAFIGTFPASAQDFVAAFLETQLFATRADDLLGSVKLI
eukprot:c20616_g1_i1.p1 GENE.c20616_g1_i1~~c20616_g1_i1.p1  ORF type:complete len:588 (+),score=134.25 c20616_g1_i1:631-2394(+)